jgi:hypothetical protein
MPVIKDDELFINPQLIRAAHQNFISRLLPK